MPDDTLPITDDLTIIVRGLLRDGSCTIKVKECWTSLSWPQARLFLTVLGAVCDRQAKGGV